MKTVFGDAEWAARLHSFVKRGDAHGVTRLVNRGADPNAQDEHGDTPLYVAAGNDHAQTVTALVNAGADPNAKGKDGRPPLDVAKGSIAEKAIAAGAAAAQE